MRDTEQQSGEATAKDWLAAIVLAESAALFIALATTFLPGRSGSTWSPADLVFDDPSQFVRVAVNYLFVNLLLFVIAVGGWLYLRFTRGDQS